MRLRLIVSVLVLVLSGADSGAAAICAASCTLSESPGGAGLHRHNYREHHIRDHGASYLDVRRHVHRDVNEHNVRASEVRDHGKMCAECPAKSENGLKSAADCGGAAGIQGLAESGFLVVASRQIEGALVTSASSSPLLACWQPQSVVFGISPTSKSSSASSLPLRI